MFNKNKLPLHTMYTSPDPFITMIRQMCTKDKVVQLLYQNAISWSDVPSDDDVLELDDWKSYEKIATRAKEAYQHHVTAHKKVYTIPQRSKTKKHCNKIASRIPYITLKQRSEPTKEIVEEIVEEIVHQPPIEYQEMELIPPNEMAPNEMASTEIIEINPEPIKKISSLYVLYYLVFLSLIIILYRMKHK